MGCGSSKDAVNVSPNLVVIGGFLHEGSTQSTRIDIYSLKRCEFLKSLELPSLSTSGSLKTGFSIANDGRSPLLYITGGCYGESDAPTNLAWKMDLSAADETMYERLPNMPVCLSDHQSLLVRKNETEFLYISDGKTVQCLNLSSKEWTTLPSLPSAMKTLNSLLNFGDKIFLAGDGKLFSYTQGASSDENQSSWTVEKESEFPSGNAVNLGKNIYIQCANEKILYKYNIESKSLGKVKGMDTLHMQNNATTTIGDSLIYFIGGSNAESKSGLKDIVEYSAKKNRFAVAGYLKESVEGHVACFYVDVK